MFIIKLLITKDILKAEYKIDEEIYKEFCFCNYIYQDAIFSFFVSKIFVINVNKKLKKQRSR